MKHAHGTCLIWMDDNIHDQEYVIMRKRLQECFGFKKIFISNCWNGLGNLLSQAYEGGYKVSLIICDKEFGDFDVGASVLRDVVNGKYENEYPNSRRISLALASNDIAVSDAFKSIDKGQLKRVTKENKYDEPAGVQIIRLLHSFRGTNCRLKEALKQGFKEEGYATKEKTLEGLKIVLDCANGAAYHVAPIILQELGAEVIAINHTPDGFNINEGCGSTHPENVSKKVLEKKAHLGIALDGDADRLLMCDEKGESIDGDQLMGVIAMHLKNSGQLKGNAITATVMSNLGLEIFLRENGIELHRTKVGDRYVTEHMRENGLNLGGEQSGHLVLSDYSQTGDALVAALQVLASYDGKKPFSKFARCFAPLPQILKNFRYQDTDNAEALVNKAQQTAIEAERKLAGSGRILIRKSGTEPLIRVMAEGTDQKKITQIVEDIIKSLN